VYNLEEIKDNLERINTKQDEMFEKISAIHIQTTQTNGRVTAIERETSAIWKVLTGVGFVLAIVVAVLLTRGIITVDQLPLN